jgi:hypothetical protein
MDQVLDNALRRRPVALKAPKAEIIEPGEQLEEHPAAPDKVRRGFPVTDQPPAVAGPESAAADRQRVSS